MKGVLAFEKSESSYRLEEVHFVVPLGFRAINGLRRAKWKRQNQGTICWLIMYQVVQARARLLGVSKYIFDEGAIIGPFSVLGKNVIIRSNVAFLIIYNR